MKKIYVMVLIALTVLICSAPVLGQVSATIDRNQLALDETLNLTINLEDGAAIDDSDLKPIENDFRILGRSRSSKKQYVNGAYSSSSSLDLVLAPKRAGILEIPALHIGKEKTGSIMVKVVTQAQPKTRADDAPLFIETEVDEPSVFVQSQVILTLRILWAVDASIAEPADPQINDALVERLKDTTFNKEIDGRSYKVFERKFAIFPQKIGQLAIPQIVVQATVPTRQRQGYDFFGSRGKDVKLRSESIVITVKETPPNYPQGKEWLPTDKLSVAEEWSREPGELLEGESATVTIALAAHGLLGEQLPPIALPETEGIKLYQGKAEVQNLANSDGITGIRKESIALIPVRPGQFELPEIRVPWWNKKLQKVEYAVIPARKLQVQASGPSAPTIAVPPVVVDPGAAGKTPPIDNTSIAEMMTYNKPLLALCTVLFIALLITCYLLLRTRQQLAAITNSDRPRSAMAAGLDEGAAFKDLARCCRANDPAAARKALLEWAGSFQPKMKVQSGADLARVFPDADFAAFIAEIDQLLYRPDRQDGTWSGKELLAAAENARKNPIREIKNRSGLPQLYR